jgi:hypothetical protein
MILDRILFRLPEDLLPLPADVQMIHEMIDDKRRGAGMAFHPRRWRI